MKRSSKFNASLFAIAIISFFALSHTNAKAVTFSSQVRYSGATRIETAAAISKGGWTKSDNVVLSYSENFPDALTAVPFAYNKNAPILLTGTDALPQATMNEIKRLNAKNIYLLGGKGVISDAIENNLKSLGYTVTRLGGTDRFETSQKIADIVNEANTSKTAVLTTAYNYPDALAVDPYAAMNGIPILYTDPAILTPSSENWIVSHGIQKVIITGGTGAVSKDIQDKLTNKGIQTQRISGADRYETALNIVKTFQSSFQNSVALTTGEDFPDALAGGVLAAKNKTPILLVNQYTMADGVADYIRFKDNMSLMIFGGTGVVQENVSAYFKKIVVVDPGHDYGGDGGAVGNGYTEQDLNMQVAVKVQASLEARGYRVILTRKPWEKPVSSSMLESLQSRVALAESVKADLFISIHHDSGGTTSSGVSTHYSTYKPNIDTEGIVIGTDPGGWTFDNLYIDTTPSPAAILGRDLANNIVNKLSASMGYPNQKAHDHGLYVTKNTTMGAVLVECGYISNPEEAARSANPDNQAKIGENIAASVKEVLK
ncbi:MAG: cell wall-binding repeat-containing protein [Clostridiaceae bacterium]